MFNFWCSKQGLNSQQYNSLYMQALWKKRDFSKFFDLSQKFTGSERDPHRQDCEQGQGLVIWAEGADLNSVALGWRSVHNMKGKQNAMGTQSHFLPRPCRGAAPVLALSPRLGWTQPRQSFQHACDKAGGRRLHLNSPRQPLEPMRFPLWWEL